MSIVGSAPRSAAWCRRSAPVRRGWRRGRHGRRRRARRPLAIEARSRRGPRHSAESAAAPRVKVFAGRQPEALGAEGEQSQLLRVKPSKRFTPDRMRISSSSAIASPVRERSVQAADESARIARKSIRSGRSAYRVKIDFAGRPGSPGRCGPTLRKPVRAPACIRRFLSQEFRHWKDRARSSGASGKRGFRACGW